MSLRERLAKAGLRPRPTDQDHTGSDRQQGHHRETRDLGTGEGQDARRSGADTSTNLCTVASVEDIPLYLGAGCRPLRGERWARNANEADRQDDGGKNDAYPSHFDSLPCFPTSPVIARVIIPLRTVTNKRPPEVSLC